MRHANEHGECKYALLIDVDLLAAKLHDFIHYNSAACGENRILHKFWTKY